MKHIVILMIWTLLGLQSKAQEELKFGDVRYDGYKNITHGAYWKKRPEAKEVYEGRFPAGVEVYRLTEAKWVRFADDEHNSKDGNYIVFPVGALVYKKNGEMYAASCGNRIVFMKSVNEVKIIEVPVYIKSDPDTVYPKPKPEKKVEKQQEEEEELLDNPEPKAKSTWTPGNQQKTEVVYKEKRQRRPLRFNIRFNFGNGRSRTNYPTDGGPVWVPPNGDGPAWVPPHGGGPVWVPPHN